MRLHLRLIAATCFSTVASAQATAPADSTDPVRQLVARLDLEDRRFRADVIALQPRAVHLMAGTNDIAGNTGPATLQDVKNNLMSMVELARAHDISVLLGSIPPAAAFDWRPGLDPRPLIAELNAWLRDYAASEGLVYIDYHTALASPDGALRSELGNDGVHPNRDGYAVMRRVLESHLP